jgi:DNA-binding NtrC family response regulator
MNLNILYVEDELIWRSIISKFLEPYGEVTSVCSKDEAFDALKEKSFDIAFIDLDLKERLEGFEVVKLSKLYDFYPTIISSNIEKSIIEAGYLYGARDYLVKSNDQDDIKNSISDIFYEFQKKKNEIQIEQKIQSSYISVDPNSIQALDIVKRFDQNTSGVFIVGETGTGKKVVGDLVNEIINDSGLYHHLNCATLNTSTIMSELFGHVKGAFTGATSDRVGILEKSNNGCLFLDEVHEMPMEAQRALLTFLEDGVITPLGAKKSKKLNVKIICGAREDIEQRIEKGFFKDDLFFRLSKKRINLLPLRLRKKDILFQIEYFLSQKLRKSVAFVIKDEAKLLLKKYDWPGNTRELVTLVDSWISNGIRVVDVDNLPNNILNNEKPKYGLNSEYAELLEKVGYTEFISIMKSLAVEHAIDNTNSNAEAGRLIGVGRSLIQKYKSKASNTEVSL